MKKEQALVLLASLFVLSACAILYELLISTVSSYLLGSSILHFSVTIGLFLTFLGLGAYLSRFLEPPLLPKFIMIEILLGAAGGCSAAVLYLANAWFANYYVLLVGVVAGIGTLAGMEIPLVTRLLEKAGTLRDVLARVLAFDYLGALAASLVFPLLLLPVLGSMRTAFFTGLINWSVAIFNLVVFRKDLPRMFPLVAAASATGILLLGGFVFSFRLISFSDALHFQDQVIFSKQTAYQRLVVTQWNDDLRLHINGNLQFSSIDEYRYHEPLIHIPLQAAGTRDSILVLGGGDGLAIREILKYPEVRHIDLVDIDPDMVALAKTNPLFTKLNKGALDDPRVDAHFEDAFNFVKHCSQRYNVIVIDLPDPSEPAIAKLYSTAFYRMVAQILSKDGVMVTQSTSPFFAREPFWCIHHTLQTAFRVVIPYHCYVPSFGPWGFQMATNSPVVGVDSMLSRIPANFASDAIDARFLTAENIPSLFRFDADSREVPTPVNTLEKMELAHLYERSFNQFR